MSFKRKLNLFDATMLVIGNVVGAGIFTTAGFLAEEFNNPWLFVGIWVIGGFLTLCGALTYAEMAGMFPASGGDYLYLKEAYGHYAGFLLNWVCFWIINPGSVAVLSIALAKYFEGLIGYSGILSEKITALVVVLFFFIINLRGVRLSGITQNLWTAGSLIILLFLITGGLVSGRGDWGHFAGNETGNFSITRLFGPAMIAVIFSYSGWFVSAYIGDEIKKPERNLPLSIVYGTIIVTVLYVAVNMVYLYAIPLEGIKGVVNIGEVVGRKLLNPGIVNVVSVAIILSIAASINATVLAGARLSYAIAKDGFFWLYLKRLHVRHGTPHTALIVQAMLSCFYIVTGTFDNLLSAVVFVMLVSSVASAAAHLILRRKKPFLERPYRTWGYPFTPIIFIISYSYIAMQIFISNPLRYAMGTIIVLTGIPFYVYLRSRAREGTADVNAIATPSQGTDR